MAAISCPLCGTYFKRKFGAILVDGTTVCVDCKVRELAKNMENDSEAQSPVSFVCLVAHITQKDVILLRR